MVKYIRTKGEKFINSMTDYNDLMVSDVNETIRMFNDLIAEYGCVDLRLFYTVICGVPNYEPSYTDVNYGWTKRINIIDNFVMEYNYNTTRVYFVFDLPEPKLLK